MVALRYFPSNDPLGEVILPATVDGEDWHVLLPDGWTHETYALLIVSDVHAGERVIVHLREL